MPSYKSIGTIDTGVYGGAGGGGYVSSMPMRMTDSAIANGGAFLVSELEKLDPKISEPLSSFTYPRDIPVKVGGGLVETIGKLNIEYGVSGGSLDGGVSADGASDSAVIQANISKDVFRTHLFKRTLRLGYFAVQRQQLVGRSLEQMLTDGIRRDYDKHMDGNVYVGLASYGTTGLINNPNITAQGVAQGASGETEWTTKTPDEILNDVNNAIYAGWEAAEFDLAAIPNQVLIPYAQYNYIATQKVSPLAEKTILTFLLENNTTKLNNGGELVIAATAWCQGTGAGQTDRMVAYVNNERFLKVEELVALQRYMTAPNTDKQSYDSLYYANLSEVEIFYEEPITYWDGI